MLKSHSLTNLPRSNKCYGELSRGDNGGGNKYLQDLDPKSPLHKEERGGDFGWCKSPLSIPSKKHEFGWGNQEE
jgi:hypothetical protein